MDRELPPPVAIDLEDLVDEVRHLHLDVVISLCGRTGRVEPDAQAPRGAEILLADHGALRWFDGSLDCWSYPPLDAAGTLAEALRPAIALPAVAGDRI